MMLNKHSVDINTILNHLEKHPRWGRRNRGLFALRTSLRLKDLAGLRLCDVVDGNGIPLEQFVSRKDGKTFTLSPLARSELSRYLALEFGITALERRCQFRDLGHRFLFPTAKSLHHSSNTLAQMLSKCDHALRIEFSKL